MRKHFLSFAIYGLSTAIGLIAFLYPFIIPVLLPEQAGQGSNTAHSADAPFVLALLVGLCFIVLLLEVQGQAISAKLVALLGILIAINSVLRFIEVAIPAPGGISPIFFLIGTTGYVYGGRFGFLMGALTLLVSALITGGIGPWLPYQMFTAGWMGLSAPLCAPLVRLFHAKGSWLEIIILAAYGAIWGILYGAIMNIWFWPFTTGPTEQYWQPGISIWQILQRYTAFYLATSLVWDSIRGVGNILLTVTFGLPTLRALRRFKRKFAFEYREASPLKIIDLP